MNKLKSVTLEGFKSFAREAPDVSQFPMPGSGRVTNTLQLGDVTVLIGANGAGKSTISSFFDLVDFMCTGALQTYVGRQGGGDSLLNYGSKRTPVMRAELAFEDYGAGRKSSYEMHLAHAAGGRMIFTNETIRYSRLNNNTHSSNELGGGHLESLLKVAGENGLETARVLYSHLCRYKAFHFHDTSAGAKIREGGYIEDNRYLRSDGGNLAAYLYALKSIGSARPFYERIVGTIQLAFPHLLDFELVPRELNDKYILLNWRAREDDSYLFGPHQLSDGTLRFAALATLLLQPPDKLPNLIVLDEPELGLHPHAIALLADMLKSAASTAQVLVATQSPVLVDHFEINQIRPIENRNGCSQILELDANAYRDWLDEYSTGELWEKNVIGGGARP